LGEYTLTQEGFRKGAVQRTIPLRAWQVQAAYILTGEQKSGGGVDPLRNFDPQNGQWGAVELAIRVGDFSAGKAVYDYGFADPARAARRAHEWVGGVNWYLNRLVRLSLDCGLTNFAGGAATDDRASEITVIGRFQLKFN
jgi:phosphate-selective porin OprO/OprP